MLLSVYWTFVLLVGQSINHCTVISARTPLYIGGLFPLSEGSSRDFGRTSLAGSMRAVEDINNRSDVLPEYEIVLDYADTEVCMFKIIQYVTLRIYLLLLLKQLFWTRIVIVGWFPPWQKNMSWIFYLGDNIMKMFN